LDDEPLLFGESVAKNVWDRKRGHGGLDVTPALKLMYTKAGKKDYVCMGACVTSTV
jgi:hypothetical protein